MQSGELIVTGKNNILIPLHRPAFPSEVRVRFIDDGPEAAPCDPGNSDTLEFEVRPNSVGVFILFISWSVSSVREIKWHVAY
jgi:hypothetical protein